MMTKSGFSFKDPVDIRVKDVDDSIIAAAYPGSDGDAREMGQKDSPAKT